LLDVGKMGGMPRFVHQHCQFVRPLPIAEGSASDVKFATATASYRRVSSRQVEASGRIRY
jgi:hypothetical protein